MTTTTAVERTAKVLAETVAVLLDYYERPVTAPDGDDPTGSYRKQRDQQSRDAHTMVTRALKAGVSTRRIAAESHLPGLLVINFVDDPQDRADAYAAEVHHLERSLEMVRQARAKDARDRYYEGQAEKGIKARLAESYGVSRPTLDAWLAVEE